MKTIQGKEFNFCDVILYNHSNKEIIMIVNDTENLEKFKYTGNPSDAPVIIVPYNLETEKQVIKNMKKIQKYEKSENGIEVLYADNTKVNFDLSNEQVIEDNLKAQNDLVKEEITINLSNISEEEKEEKKKDIISKLKKGIITILANLTVITNNLNSKKVKSKKRLNKVDNIFVNNVLINNSKNLYLEILNKNQFLLKYQEIVNINWNEDLALELVELLNGSYSNSIKNMNFDTANNEIKRILQSLVLIVTGNLVPEVSVKEMIDLSKYFEDSKSKVLIHNTMLVAKNVVNELIGEQINNQFLDESNYSTINKFSNEYKGAIDQLLNYEFKTLNDRDFLEMNNISKWIITLIFKQINVLVSEESAIDIEVAGIIQKMYYRYFSDVVENKIYLPKLEIDGNIAYYENTTNQRYSKEEMFALAGLSLLDENKIEPNPNIYEMGIYANVDEKFNFSSEEIFKIN